MHGIKKVEKFMWSKEVEQDFLELKKAFTKGGIQAFPDFGVGDLLTLTLDWSKENIVGVFPRCRMDKRDSDAGDGNVTNMIKIVQVTKGNC